MLAKCVEITVREMSQINIDLLDNKVRKRAGIEHELFLSDSVINLIETSAALEALGLSWILYDICYMFAVKSKANHQNINPMPFTVYINMSLKEGKVNAEPMKFYAAVSPMNNNDPQPVITIMREEDLQTS